MKNFIKKVLQADQWAHHHTALVLTGVFLSGFMAFWQLFVPTFQTHAANLVCGTAFNIAVPVSECQALVDLYTYTNGDAWTNNTNWNTDTNICLWEGIGCTPADGSGFAHVQIIDLDENNLNGSVPQTIGNLPYLTSVALYRNNNLVVNLEIFQGLTGLQWLSAYNTNLQGNFDALSGLTDIRELSLSCRDTFAQCDVTGNLDTVSGMMYMYGLSVDGLGLEGTLDPIYDKYLLQNLDLDGNSISGPIGAAFGGLTGLVDIEMGNNQLDGSIPAEIGNLINATELSINNNQLTGPIPDEIGNLTNLQILNLANNEFDSVPSTLSNLTNLTYLGLARNKIEGEFPVDFNGWNNLQTIWMGDNTGMVVDIDAFADLGTSVQNITIDNTMLTGTISSLSGLIGLTDLNMSCWNTPCDVDGLINDLGNLTAMQNISIQNAGVGGTLDDLYNLSQLQTFRLNGNSIGGTLGAGVANWTVLIKLELQDNLFTGALPAELGQLTQLQFLNLAGNNFNGELPDLDGFYQINSIYLGGNNWVGTLPSSWGDLTTLTTINVGGNSLSASYLHGNLPSSWGNLTNLQRLDIQFTSITGSLPESWGNWTNLGRLTLFYNDLTGPIPDSYSGFLLNNSMERFWLNNNHLDGDLPTWFGDVTSYGKIEANCLDTDHLDSDAQSNLDEYFTNWDAQSNCLPDVRLSTRIVGDITPGNVVDYYIDYENIGEQRAANLIISQDFADGISIVTDYSSGSDGLISADYFVSEDACYSDMLYNGEGPYADYLANVLIRYTGMPQGTGTLTEVADRVFRDGSDFGGIDLQSMRDMFGDQQLGSGGMVTTFFCAFAAGILADGNPDQQVMQDFYNDLGAQCLVPLFAIDPRDIATEECGANKLYGYNWDIGNLAAGTSGTIHLKLQVPSNAGAGMTFQNAAYLQMDGENQSEEGNEQTFSFVVVSNNNNGGGGSAGGGGSSSGPGNETDEKAGLCSVRDCSDSSYDDVCGVCNAEEIAESVVEKQEHATAPTSFVPDAATLAAYIQAVGDDIQGTTEQIAAFLFAKAAGLTTMADFTTVRPFDGVTRAEFSKLLVGFLENVLGRKADGSRLRMCSQYNDVDSSLGDLELTIYKSCMHKVMGLQNDGNTPLDTFNPHEVMTRKYVVTTLSRVIWGNKYDNGDPFYVKHMQAMQDAGLVSLPDPEMPEQRMNAFTIMMRMAEQFDSLFE